mmetsp:Transcript_38824/g.116734  ORF Transcript_38824/g.116734 Transcript_38824/m.116734 type:complete len:246 (-) Transcript_38824:321-1058(-)
MSTKEGKVEEDGADPPRNFTVVQLRKFDGTDDDKGRAQPLYISAEGIVFDASDDSGRATFGPGGPFESFSGRECGAALAKGCLTDDESRLDLSACGTLSSHERANLTDWIDRLKHQRRYPVLGRLIPDDKLPSPDRVLSKEELSSHIGEGDIPDGYAHSPIYLGVAGKVYDVSFGGVVFYGPGGGYHRFAGKDASRALAKMSFDPKDTEEPDISDLTEKEKKVLNDWIKTFEERKMYPRVGRLKD